MTRSIFGRLMISHIAVILLTTIVLGIFMSYLIKGHVVEAKRQELLAKGTILTTLLAPAVNSGRFPDRLDIIGDIAGARIWIVSPGKLLAGEPPQRWRRDVPGDPEQIAALFAGTPQSWVRNARNQSDPSIIVGIPIPNTVMPAALFLYTPITGVNNTVGSIERLLIYSLLLGMAAAIIMGFLISRSMTSPIADISRAATRFAGGDYDSRTKATGEDEIGKLGQVFNSMAESLAHIEQNRREFLANVSHELKTPVASIQALAEALHDGMVPDEDKRRRYLSTIVSQSQHIDSIIRDLLDLAQLEAGELSIVIGKVDLGTFLPAELTKYDHRAAEKNVSLALELPTGTSAVLADSMRLSQIMANLITNAIRHAPADTKVSVTVRPTRTAVEITVSDQGPGIPLEAQPYVWDRFYRVDNSRARSEGGTGLGLSITRRLVEAMGGIITLASVPGKGASFTFTLPIEA